MEAGRGGHTAGTSELNDRSTWKVLETDLPLPRALKKGEEKSLGWGGGWELLGSYLRASFLVTLPESF